MIKLGSKVRDKVSGVEGIATGRCEYLNGCIQYCVTTKVGKDNKGTSPWIDEGQLVVVGQGVSAKPEATGGPSSCEPSSTYGRGE
jgi:hypothetical protein